MFKEIGAFIDAVGSAVSTTIRRSLNDESTDSGFEGLLGGDIDLPDDGLLGIWDERNDGEYIIVKTDSED